MLNPTDVKDGAIEIRLIRPQVHRSDAHPPCRMAIKIKESSRWPYWVLPRDCHQRVDLIRGQIFAGSQVLVLCPLGQ